MQLSPGMAQKLAAMPLEFLPQQYPNHLMHLLNSDKDARTPAQLHPVFYGCYDWHSAVHGYWLLLRVLRLYADLPCRDKIIALFSQHFTAQHIATELDYFTAPGRAAFERPYGYGWLLALAQELAQSRLADAVVWYNLLQPLTLELRQRLMDYLEKLSYPIRAGVHANSAFALILAWDYACALDDIPLQQAIHGATDRFYLADVSYPAHYEPAGDDYLSGALTQALLMSKILRGHFTDWFDNFLPDVTQISALMTPAQVSDRTDPKIVHLDGLNLSRAWCMKHIAQALPAEHIARQGLIQAAQRHLQASAGHVTDSHYSGGHWLATFALLAYSEAPYNI